MNSNNINVTKNDCGFDIKFVVKDGDGAKINITGTTIKFQLSDMNYVNKVNGDCVITDAVNGECKYTVASGDLNLTAGQYKAALEITWNPNKKVSTNQFIIQILNECG